MKIVQRSGGSRLGDELTLLHLSDPQFGKNHRFGSEEPFDTLFARLVDDLDKLADEYELRPDLVVVSGDLAEWGLRSEFEQALDFLRKLAEHLNLSPRRFAIIPGNHDINRKTCEAYFAQCAGDEKEPKAPYWPKWKHFVWMFREFYGDAASFTSDQPWTMFEMDDLGVVVAGLNSTIAESHDDGHWGACGEEQYQWFAQELGKYGRGSLRIAAVHHNVMRRAVADDENLRDADDLRRVLGNAVDVVLHGHEHRSLMERLGDLPVLATGSASLKQREKQPGEFGTPYDEVPNQYQILRFSADNIRRWPRAYAPENKEWAADTRTTASRELPYDDVKFRWNKVFYRNERHPGRISHKPFSGSRDDFLDRVAETCRVRYEESGRRVEVKRVTARSGAFEYLRARIDEGGRCCHFPVGAVQGDLDERFLKAFSALHEEYRDEDPHITSDLVCAAKPDPELQRDLNERGIRLWSLTQYRNLVDFREATARWTALLAEDKNYPSHLYVDQKLVKESNSERSDAMQTLHEWIVEPDGRFVLILGEFGTGKTFLMHEIARRLGERLDQEDGAVVPILIDLKELHQARTLDELLASHLVRESPENFEFKTIKTVRHMLRRGRLVLLFDGFDELVQRVTWDRATEHFRTLVEAAAGEANVVVTSRTEHFKTHRHVEGALISHLTTLGDNVKRIAGHRIATLQRFEEEQIREMLSRLLGPEEGEDRFRLLGEIEDLRGLAANPRMLSFIADLKKPTLLAAQELDGVISSARLYELLFDRWLGFERERLERPGAALTLDEEERLRGATELAVLLWQRSERSTTVEELERVMPGYLGKLKEGKPRDAELAFVFGTGTFLTRDRDGRFSFFHLSVLEWLVARRAASELESGKNGETFGLAEASDLTAKFFCELVGRDRAMQWMAEALAGSHPIERDNALVLRKHLDATSPPLKIVLAGQDLRGQDFSGENYIGADLRGADLREAKFLDADLRNADLRGVNLRRASLLGADLRGASLDRADLRRTKLISSKVDVDALESTHQFGTALPFTEIEPCSLVTASYMCNSIAFIPESEGCDCSLLATSHADGVIRIWDLKSHQLIRSLVGDSEFTGRMSFSLDGKIVASGSVDGSIHLWDVSRGKEIVALGADPEQIDSVWLSGDGSSVLSVSVYGTTHFWPICKGDGQRILQGEIDGFYPLCFSPGGRLLASSTEENTISIWDVFRRQEISVLVADSLVEKSSFSSDGRMLVSSDAKGLICLWDVESAVKTGTLRGHEEQVLCLCFSSDGQWVVSSSSDKSVRVWDVSSKREIEKRVYTESVYNVSVSSDGSTIAAVSPSNSIHLWGVNIEQASWIKQESVGEIGGVSFSSEGRMLASGWGQKINFWDIRLGLIGSVERNNQVVTSLSFGPGDQMIVSGSDDFSVRLWDVDYGQINVFRGHASDVNDVSFSPDGRTIASASRDKTVRLWDVIDSQAVGVLQGHTNSVLSICFSPDSHILASGSMDESVCLWDTKTRQLTKVLEGHSSDVESVCFSPDGKVLASGAGDASVCLWDVQSGHKVKTLSTNYFGDCICFSPNGRILVSADYNLIHMWDIDSGVELQILKGHSNSIRSVCFSPDGRILASGSRDNTIRLWDVQTGACLALLYAAPEGWVAYRPDGKYRFGGSITGYFWHVAALCRFEPGELDPFLDEPLLLRDDEPLYMFPE